MYSNPSSKPLSEDGIESSLTDLFRSLEHDLTRDVNAQAQPIAPSADLCVLAILAESHDLLVDSGGQLARPSRVRLSTLVGGRPRHYWDDVLRCARTLRLLHVDDGQVRVTNTDAELLGATCSECFPAFLATWLQDAAWMGEVFESHGVEGEPGVGLRLDLVRALGVFEPSRWYRVGTLERLVTVVFGWHGVRLTPSQRSALPRDLLSRALLVVGAVEVSACGDAFRLKPRLTLPPLPSQLEGRMGGLRPSTLARRFRDVIETRLSCNDAWSRVNHQLQQVVECRRSRQCGEDALKMLDDVLIETCPTTPFRDCLYLARFGELVQPQAGLQGRYVFRLDAARLSRRLPDAGGAGELLQFVSRRSADASTLQRVKALLSSLGETA